MVALVPTVLQRTNRGERVADVFSRLLEDRIVFLGSAIDDQVADVVVAQLLHLEAEAPGRDVALYINSPGGDMTALFAIYDTMQYIASDVATICVGQACSAAAVLLASGAPGKRAVLPNSRVLIHQPHGGVQGQTADIELAASEFAEMRDRMIAILVRHTGQPEARVRADIDRDYIVRDSQAVAYGLVDEVLTRRALPGPHAVAAG
jgi:ATP-dependent Clp protease protease subunit